MKKSFSLAALLAFASGAFADWPQAAGPNGNWKTEGTAPLTWSVTRNQNIVWKTTLPEVGQSGIAIANGRVFLTTMKPLPADATKKEGSDIVGYCLDAKDGKILWTVDLPGSEPSTYAYGFSDSSTPSPITDGKYVWFYNASGALGCYDYFGKQIWKREWKPTANGRPFNTQFEPMMVGDAILNVEPRDEGDPKREADPWNYLRALDKTTGKTLWVADDALTHYNTPMMGVLSDGTPAVLQGRGGHHEVPERPEGLSLTSLAPGNAGKTLWRYETKAHALYVMHFDKRYAYWLGETEGEHRVLDVKTGQLLRTQSLTDKVDLRTYDEAAKKHTLQADADLKKLTPPVNVMPAWFSNIVVGDYHYFTCFTDAGAKRGPAYSIGRVNGETGKVEYLEVPVQVLREVGKPDEFIWHKAQPSSTVNARGVDVAGDPRSKRDGWYWNFNGTPTAVGGKIFFTSMLGVTYVIDGFAPVFDEKALLAVNDLGPGGQTWSLNSISYSDGRLYHRSMKEVVCIGK
jgi:outer membrane protein assembly factor BamB